MLVYHDMVNKTTKIMQDLPR